MTDLFFSSLIEDHLIEDVFFLLWAFITEIMKTVVNFFYCTKMFFFFFTEKGKQRKGKLQSAGQSIEPNNA